MTGAMPPRPAHGSAGNCGCEHVAHDDHPRAVGRGPHGHPYGAEVDKLVYWCRPISAAVCGPCGLSIMAEFPEEVAVL